MEIHRILRKNERNNFPDPMRHMRQADEVDDDPEVCVNSPHCATNEDVIGVFGVGILRMIRDYKAEIIRHGILMSVGTAVKTYTDRMAEAARNAGETEATIESHYKGIEGTLLTTIKLLANDGLIKLSDATAEFEDRKIVQYHATAEPKFRSGKFRL